MEPGSGNGVLPRTKPCQQVRKFPRSKPQVLILAQQLIFHKGSTLLHLLFSQILQGNLQWQSPGVYGELHTDILGTGVVVLWEKLLLSSKKQKKKSPQKKKEKLLPLPKFESEFGKIYTAQKLWKVPNPYLRKTLREAIIEKIIPGYEEYIENNHVTTSKFTPRNLEEMLHELFEG